MTPPTAISSGRKLLAPSIIRPGCVSPSIKTALVICGSADPSTIMSTGGEPVITKSIVLTQLLVFAKVIASRRLPIPLSALFVTVFVTVQTAARAICRGNKFAKAVMSANTAHTRIASGRRNIIVSWGSGQIMNDQYSVLAYYRETRLRTLLTQCRRALVWVNLAIVSAILVLLRQTRPHTATRIISIATLESTISPKHASSPLCSLSHFLPFTFDAIALASRKCKRDFERWMWYNERVAEPARIPNCQAKPSI